MEITNWLKGAINYIVRYFDFNQRAKAGYNIPKLENNTVLITGGGSGIGLAFAEALVQLGNTVIICGRNAAKLERAKSLYPALHTIRCDISNDQDINLLLETIGSHFPTLNFLINNAAIQNNYHFLDGTSHISAIQQEIDTNLTANIKLIDMLLPILQHQSTSTIFNITSALARVPKENAPVYCATKAGMHIFTKALRYQLETSNIRVFEIVPPLVDTNMTIGRGRGKISPRQVVRESLRAFSQGQYEIKIEKVKFLFALYRLFPGLAEAMIRKS